MKVGCKAKLTTIDNVIVACECAHNHPKRKLHTFGLKYSKVKWKVLPNLFVRFKTWVELNRLKFILEKIRAITAIKQILLYTWLEKYYWFDSTRLGVEILYDFILYVVLLYKFYKVFLLTNNEYRLNKLNCCCLMLL